MFDVVVQDIEPKQITRYRITVDDVALTYSTVLDLWQSNEGFRSCFTTVLASSSFAGYRWETPAISKSTVERPFEFVLINSPGFCVRETDTTTYARYFTDDDTNDGIITFANLRGDATLIAPSPRTSNTAYGHLAAFVRNAPESQVDSIWRVLSTRVHSELGHKPIWISTAGGGVAWLHVRIDSEPRYYGYEPYRTTEG